MTFDDLPVPCYFHFTITENQEPGAFVKLDAQHYIWCATQSGWNKPSRMTPAVTHREVFKTNADGAPMDRQKKSMQLYVVPTISTFVHQYLVEAMDGASAQKLVEDRLMDEECLIEWTQEHLMEKILPVASLGIPMTRSQLAIAHRDTPNASSWMNIDNLINRSLNEK